MRLTCFCIGLALAAGFFVDRTLAQIPERITFQPGSFAYGYRPGTTVPGVAMAVPFASAIETPTDDVATDESGAQKNEWDVFSKKPKKPEISNSPNQASSGDSTGKPPYLAWHRSPWTGRIHLIPYQPGYTDAPEQFPTHQSKLNHWLSSLPSREQNRPQQTYLGYYDPMPTVQTDKPSRRQLLLGYGDSNWTTSCCNSPSRAKTAHCPGVDPICFGPSAEARIVDQCIYSGPLSGRGFMPAPHVGTMHGGFRGAFGYQRGFMPQPCPCPECVQQRSCPECVQQYPCPECKQCQMGLRPLRSVRTPDCVVETPPCGE